MATDSPNADDWGIAFTQGVPRFALPGARTAGDHAIYKGEQATLWMRVARQRDRSTYYLTIRDGFRQRRTAEEPITAEGWRRITAEFAQSDPEEWARREQQAARQRIWDTLSGNELDIVVSNVFLVGGFGLGPFVKTRPHQLRFGDDTVIVSMPGTAIQAYSYSDVSAIAVDGETITTGGGFIGGGFGVEGAAEGMAVASVLNALTTRTNIKTILELQVGQSHFVFLSTTEGARAMTTRLLPIKAKLRLASEDTPAEQASTSPTPDPITQLERLAALHSSGALTDAEFASAKQRLILG